MDFEKPEIDDIGTIGDFSVTSVGTSVLLKRTDSLRPGPEALLDKEQAVKLATLLLMAAVDH
jgi:hypothetical protein